MSAFRDCIVSFIDLNDIGRLLRRKSKRGVRIIRELHRLVSSRVHDLNEHEEVCFWQDSVLLLGLVDTTNAKYCRVMKDVSTLYEAVNGLYPSHVV